ncbi:hypothetical protein [Deinococcus xinjiangensis]|uniref:hypothetical protein n=1 Tax=Deinococcus xinjiangensis TaxID=457454 RepID=UPI00336540F8
MNDSELTKRVVQILRNLDGINVADNICPESYNDGTVGGCFPSKSAADEVAHAFYKSMFSNGYVIKYPLRQDYLVWTGVFQTKDLNKSIVFKVDTLEDAKQRDGRNWDLHQLGYRTLINIDIHDSSS